MNIPPLLPIEGLSDSVQYQAIEQERPEEARTFGQMLKDSLAAVDQAQRRADEEALKLVSGEAEDLHDVVIATEEASLLLSLTLEIRNRAVEAYQELMRIQI